MGAVWVVALIVLATAGVLLGRAAGVAVFDEDMDKNGIKFKI